MASNHGYIRGFSTWAKFALVFVAVAIPLLLLYVFQATGGAFINVTLQQSDSLASGLVAHYTFDGETVNPTTPGGEIADSAGNGNTGNWLNHATTTTAGPIGQAIEFDGVDDSVSIGDIGNGVQSIAFWVKPSSNTDPLIRLNDSGGSGSTNWYDSNYQYCRPFTMDHTQVATTTSSGFALYASSTVSSLAHTDHGGNIQLLQEDDSNTPGQVPTDVVITDGTDCNADGGTKIPFYFEDYASTTGAFDLWVEHPDVSSTTDKTMLVYYGNASASDQSNESGVFGALDEEAVYNLHEDPGSAGTDGIKDSTGNSNDGTDNGSMTSTDRNENRVDGNLDFDGSNDRVDIDTALNSALSGSITFSAWIRPETTNSAAVLNIIDGGGSFTAYKLFRLRTSFDNWKILDDTDTSHGINYNTDPPANEWSHVVGVYNQSTGYMKLYRNGALDNEQNTGSFTYEQTSEEASIARDPRGQTYFTGNIDDVRVHNRALTSADIETQYNNTRASAAFWTIGSQQTESAGGDEVSVSLSSGTLQTSGFTAPTVLVNGSTSSSVTVGEWNHVVVSDTADINATDVQLGTITGYFDGILDDVRLYTNQLSMRMAERIYQLAQ